ncbi:hypothetical protein [Listeria monocytogenes]|uniref:hypothetical protein n=1 Tax=Listeria monocytogenes TaxID=1639 RepID=UPI001387C062|nr:hypothetical protein [Listeria monocytogenes]EDN9846511.1 hypothetical protein [Listeria monocytogenes]
MTNKLFQVLKNTGLFIMQTMTTILLLAGFALIAVSAFLFSILIGLLVTGILLIILSLLIEYSKGGAN